MAFTRKAGKTKLVWFPVTPSTVILKGAVVSLSSGKLIPATNSVANKLIVGVWAGKTIAATDSDYASDRLGPVEVPVEKFVQWEADVTDGTLAATSVGAYFDLGSADTGVGVDQGNEAIDAVYCTKFISATKGWFVLSCGPEGVGTST